MVKSENKQQTPEESKVWKEKQSSLLMLWEVGWGTPSPQTWYSRKVPGSGPPEKMFCSKIQAEKHPVIWDGIAGQNVPESF